MNKADLIVRVAKDAKINHVQAARAVNSLIRSIIGAVQRGNTVTLKGFGTFSKLRRKARRGRNPQTGELLNIPAKVVPKFSPGTTFREAVRK